MNNPMNNPMNKLIDLIDRISNKEDQTDDYNDQDVSFVREMIPHHEMAVEMADKQIKKGKNDQILKIAKGIKSAQTAEIAELRKWLTERDLKEDDKGM